MRVLLLLLLLLLLCSIGAFAVDSVDLGAGPAPVTSAAPSGAAGGDLAGTYPNPTIKASVSLTTPLLGTPTSGVLTNCTGTAAGLTAGTVTTNANLTGPITSVGNATSIASQTGTGTKFVVDNGPTLVAPLLGTPASGVLTNCTGTAAGLTAGLATDTVTKTGTGSTYVTNNGPTLIAPILGAATASSLTDSGLTATRVTYSDTAGLLKDDSGFTRASAALTVDATTDGAYTLGYAKMGLATSGTATTAYFANSSDFTSTDFALRQSTGGATVLNGKTGTTLALAINGGAKASLTSSSFTLASGIPLTESDTTEASSVSAAAIINVGGLGVAKRSFLGTIGSSFKGNVDAGVQDATAAAAGQVGEVLTGAQATPTNFTTSGTIQQLATISLTPGDWLETATMTLAMNSATEVAAAEAVCYLCDTTASATGAVEGETIGYVYEPASASAIHATVTIIFHEVISASKTKYLNGKATFTAGNPQSTCSMKAVRIR